VGKWWGDMGNKKSHKKRAAAAKGKGRGRPTKGEVKKRCTGAIPLQAVAKAQEQWFDGVLNARKGKGSKKGDEYAVPLHLESGFADMNVNVFRRRSMHATIQSVQLETDDARALGDFLNEKWENTTSGLSLFAGAAPERRRGAKAALVLKGYNNFQNIRGAESFKEKDQQVGDRVLWAVGCGLRTVWVRVCVQRHTLMIEQDNLGCCMKLLPGFMALHDNALKVVVVSAAAATATATATVTATAAATATATF
jgi:hypothetical protein